MNRERRFRILIVVDSYPPVLGGSEIEAQRVSAGLIRRGHTVHVLCAGGPPMPAVREWVDPEGVPVSILARNSRGRRKHWMFALEAALELWRWRDRCDIVYFLMQGLQLAIGLPLTRLLGKPTIMKIAGSGVIPLMRTSRAGRLELDWMRNWKTPLLLLNDGMIEEAMAERFSRDQLVWMPNPVDVDIFCPRDEGERLAWRVEHGIRADARVVIYVGRLSQEKGLTGLIRGFADASRQTPEGMLLLVGDGLMRSQLEALAAELNLSPEQIRFVGRVPISEVPHWLAAADVFALTSPSEGFACALVEAMAVGLPSVVSAIPANLQLVDDEVHGLTVVWNDAGEISGALVRLVRERELCRSMGAAARERAVANYSMDAVLTLYEDLFDKVREKKA